METLNHLYPALNASNNSFESNIQAGYNKDEALINNQKLNELTSNMQYISTLRNINEVRKLNEIRNAILSNSKLRNEDSLNTTTLSSLNMEKLQNEQNTNINFAMGNMIQNQLINRIVNPKQKDEISNISTNLNLCNQNAILNSKKYTSSIPTSFNIMNNYCTPSSSSSSNTNILNNLNSFSNINSNSFFPTIQINNSTTLLPDPTSLCMNSLSQSTAFNNSFSIKNNNSLSKDQIQLLYLAKLFNDQKNQLVENKERKRKFDSMIIPSNELITTNSIVNNNINIPLTNTIENNLIDNLAKKSIIIPTADSIDNNLMNNNILIQTPELNENALNNNSFDSIIIPDNCENDRQEQLSDKLLKQFQLQEQQLASKISEDSDSKEEESIISGNSKIESTLLEIPSITINSEDINLFKSPEIISRSDIIESDKNDVDALMKLNPKQNVINYFPLSPELSPLLKSDNISSNSNQILKNCMKRNECNAFSSMNTLNNILSITPEMEPINSPVIEDNIDRFNYNNIQNDAVNEFIDPFKAINGEIEDSSNNLLTVDKDYLIAPATPNSVSYSSSPSNFDLTDFPNVIVDSFEFKNELDNSINNLSETDNDNKIKCEICNNEEQEQFTMKSKESCVEDILGDLELPKQVKNIESTIEPMKVNKKPRGRPRKKKNQETPKSPEEKLEQLSKTIDELLSSDLYSKLYAEESESDKNQSKKTCSEQDYKFIKQVDTLNYILVSYKRMCSTLCKSNECNKKSLSDATENQYDIPEELKSKFEKKEINKKFNNENSNEVEINEEIVSKDESEIKSDDEDEMDSISEGEESTESESEEKSLSLLKKEILELNSHTNNDKEDKFEDNKDEIIPIRSIETENNGRKRKHSSGDESDSCNEEQTKSKIVRLSIKQIKNSLENGNRMSIGNGLGVNSVSALTKNGLVLVGRKRIIAENTNRPYVCSTCGAGFVRKHDLNRHEKVHTGIKNYKCIYCNRAFSRNDALSRHLRVELKHRSQANEKKRGRKGSKKKTTKKEN